jgi:PAS domain S-box-containing protein
VLLTTLEDLRRENHALRTKVEEMERAVSVVRSSSEAIVSTALDGTILFWNAAAERLYGYTPGEAVGRSHLEVIPFDRLVEHATAVTRVLRGETVVLETRRRTHAGTQIPVRVLYTRLADEDGTETGFATMAHPITP